jgi:hypothetical protein
VCVRVCVCVWLGGILQCCQYLDNIAVSGRMTLEGLFGRKWQWSNLSPSRHLPTKNHDKPTRIDEIKTARLTCFIKMFLSSNTVRL